MFAPAVFTQQSAVAAAVAEKDEQLHAAQERLKRQLQEQLQRAEAEMEVRLLVGLDWTVGLLFVAVEWH